MIINDGKMGRADHGATGGGDTITIITSIPSITTITISTITTITTITFTTITTIRRECHRCDWWYVPEKRTHTVIDRLKHISRIENASAESAIMRFPHSRISRQHQMSMCFPGL